MMFQVWGAGLILAFLTTQRVLILHVFNLLRAHIMALQSAVVVKTKNSCFIEKSGYNSRDTKAQIYE
jgi:hypothetical protein